MRENKQHLESGAEILCGDKFSKIIQLFNPLQYYLECSKFLHKMN